MKNHLKGTDYIKLGKQDLIGYLQPLFKTKAAYMRDDGKIGLRGDYAFNTPWCHVKMANDRDCYLYWDIVFPNMEFIHSRCHKCWKVVVRPQTLKQLFQLLEVQMKLAKKYGFNCKCGIETRSYVAALYGGYFYNNSLKEGQRCYEKVKEAVSRDISPDVPVALKRACTEFELKFGDSSKWEITKEQLVQEALLDKYVISDKQSRHNPPDLVDIHTQRGWIEFAYNKGDSTVLEYTDGKMLFAPAVQYHNKSIVKEE